MASRPQDLIKTRPALPFRLNIGEYFQPVIIGFHQEAPQVLKLRHFFQWPVKSLEYCHCLLLSLVLLQPHKLAIFSSCIEGCHRSVAVQCRPMYGHGTGQAAWVGAVPLLHNHHRVTHVAVNKVDMKVGARPYPPLEPPHWTSGGPGR